MKHAGVAITMTSVTDLLAFGIGSSSTLLALSSFCVYAVWHQMVHFTHWKKSNEWQNSFGQVCDILTPGRSILVRLLPIYWPFFYITGNWDHLCVLLHDHFLLGLFLPWPAKDWQQEGRIYLLLEEGWWLGAKQMFGGMLILFLISWYF